MVRFLMRFLGWRESPPLVPSQSPPFHIMVDLRDLRDEFKLRMVVTE
jgi:hypothetical protein